MRQSLFLAVLLALASTANAELFTGKIVNPQGQPIADATLSLFFVEPNVPKGFHHLMAKTSSSGEFTISDFPSFGIQNLPWTMEVQFPNGDISTATFYASGATVQVKDEQIAADIRLIDEKGKSIPGVRLNVGALAQSPSGRGFTVSVEASHPGFNGFFSDQYGMVRIPKLPLGMKLSFSCERDGLPRLNGDLDLSGNRKGPIIIQLVHGMQLHGRVVHLGLPVANAQVRANSFLLKGGVWTGTGAFATTDKDGNYSLTCQAGEINLTASAGEGEHALTSREIKGIHGSPGTELDGLDLTLDEPVLISGMVLETGTERPVQGARIDNSVEGTPVITGQDGKFTLRLRPGEVQIRVPQVGSQTLGYPYPELNAVIDANHNPPITFYVDHNALLPPVVGLEGVVLSSTGQPVANARVGIVAESASATTDAQGHFKFKQPVNPGSKVYASGGGESMPQAFVLSDQHSLTLKLEIPAASISGKVVDDVGTPVSNAAVTLLGERSDFVFKVGSVTSDASGEFTFKDVYPGMPGYMLMVEKIGYGKYQREMATPKGGEIILINNLKIPVADAKISGKVVSADGSPVKGIAVLCGTVKDAAITDENGRFVLNNLPRGDDFLYLQSMDGTYGNVTAKAGATNVVITAEKQEQTGSPTYDDMKGQTVGAVQIGEWLNDSKLTSQDLKGKLIVLDLWAVWCHPCVQALPQVQALYQKYHAKGVVVLGIHMLGTPFEKAKAFVAQHDLTYPLMMDTGKGVNYTTFPAKGIPQLYLIDSNGKVLCDSHDVSEIADALEVQLRK
jgi:thiol-disulfide isomerase/thioredoxin/uncharacterized GH25 family protein